MGQRRCRKPYEFKIANAYAGAFRIDNYSVPGLRLSLSGYAGNSFSNTLSANRTGADRYKDVKGTVMIGAFDFLYDAHNWIVRGNFDYGHLTNSDKISQFNRDMPNASPSPKQYVGSDAIATGVEAGYDIFSQIRKLKERGHRFYVFGRYEFYDSMFDTAKSVIRQDWCGRQRVAVGFNYYPIKNIVIKAEYGIGPAPVVRLYRLRHRGDPHGAFQQRALPFAGDRLFRLFQTLTKS